MPLGRAETRQKWGHIRGCKSQKTTGSSKRLVEADGETHTSGYGRRYVAAA